MSSEGKQKKFRAEHEAEAAQKTTQFSLEEIQKFYPGIEIIDERSSLVSRKKKKRQTQSIAQRFEEIHQARDAELIAYLSELLHECQEWQKLEGKVRAEIWEQLKVAFAFTVVGAGGAAGSIALFRLGNILHESLQAEIADFLLFMNFVILLIFVVIMAGGLLMAADELWMEEGWSKIQSFRAQTAFQRQEKEKNIQGFATLLDFPSTATGSLVSQVLAAARAMGERESEARTQRLAEEEHVQRLQQLQERARKRLENR